LPLEISVIPTTVLSESIGFFGITNTSQFLFGSLLIIGSAYYFHYPIPILIPQRINDRDDNIQPLIGTI
jgi:hypothetical protein